MRLKLMGLLKDEEGQGMVEYGLMLAGIAAIVIVAVVLLDPTDLFTSIMATINPGP